jgi:hypothetical protein
VYKAGSKVQVVWNWKLFGISTKMPKKGCTVGGGGGGLFIYFLFIYLFIFTTCSIT